MDANGARFWMLHGPADLTASDEPARVRHDAVRGVWRLSSAREAPSLDEDLTLADERREAPRRTLDGLGSEASVGSDASETFVIVRHEGLAEREIFRTSGTISDVCIGEDGAISIATDGRIRLRHAGTLGDPREDWQTLDETLLHGDDVTSSLEAWRLAPRAGGGAWILDRDAGQLASWTGYLLRNRPDPEIAPGTFRPNPEDPQTLHLRIVHRGGFDGDTAAAIASSPGGRVAVLTTRPDADARIHLFSSEGAYERVMALTGLRHPFSLAWATEDRVAVLVTEGASSAEGARVASEAIVYPIDGPDDVALPVGERYPLRRHDGSSFLHAPDRRPRYGSETGPRPLVALSLPHRATIGTAISRTLDSEHAGTTWHRLYAEALLPEGCGIRIELAASDTPTPPTDDGAYYPHDFGDVPGSAPPIPRAAWVPARSEIPSQEGLLHCSPARERAGLFTVLVQRVGQRTRRLIGRYLHVRLVFHGTGRTTPELAALRAWGPRFSYVREYLPELYHEDPLLEGRDDPGPATPADFLERFVASFEGVLTPLEDRIAEAWRVTNPRTAPAGALDWLAGWVGLTLDPSLSERVRRRMIASAPMLASMRGTRRGLELAIEIVTDGGITRGDVVVLEDFRLRRTWATILGADLADEEDPLLGGLTVSGSSIVGDTLILGDENRREFLALFGERLVDEGEATGWVDRWRRMRDRQAVERFFEQSAHRATVLVFDATRRDVLGHVRGIVEREKPAHVRVEVKTASRSFIASVTALVGIDTRLGIEPPEGSVRLDRTRLGAGDRLQRVPALHPDVEGEGE